MRFTVLGATGFIGRNFVKYLAEKGHDVFAAPRDIKQLAGQELGHVIYTLGLTGGDSRLRPHDAIEAHITLLSWLLQNCKYESLLYCSSTRIYSGMNPDFSVSEKQPITIMPSADNLFDMSKLMGETLCNRIENPCVRVVRLSNVYGSDQSRSTFLGAVIQEANQSGNVTINDQPDSVKDYIAIEDVCELMEQIALHGENRLYNLASGENIKTSDIADWLEVEGIAVTLSAKNKLLQFPRIDNSLIVREFGYQPRKLKNDIRKLLGKS